MFLDENLSGRNGAIKPPQPLPGYWNGHAPDALRERPFHTDGQRHWRVLQVGKFYPPFKGGMETHLRDLSQELCRLLEVKILVANDANYSADELVDGIEVKRVGNWFDFASAPICPGMVRAMRDSRADIVHLHLPNPVAVLCYLVSGHRGKLVVTYHSDIVRQRLLGKAFEPLQNMILSKADAVIVTSPNYIESSPVLDVFRRKCHVVPHGIIAEKYREYDEREVRRLRRQYGERVILGVGRLVYYKGFEYLIRALPKVDARLIIIGSGPLKNRLEEIARESGVAERVALLGQVEDVTPYYHAADIFVLSSVARSEAFGIVQLEAMACGKPVVNTWLDSGVPYVSLNGLTGLTVPPQNPHALADAMNILLESAKLRERYGRAAARRVESEFSLDLMVQRTLDVYQHVMTPTNGNGHYAAETIYDAAQ
jgi:glycosyltransferase involved in cell wall biosynthesis